MTRGRRRLGPLGVVLSVPLMVSVAFTLGCPWLAQLPVDGTGTGGTTGNSGLTGKYIGSEACKTCHSPTHTGWLGTLHAGALETLEEIGRGTDATCVVCHVVGLGQAGGFVDRATTNDLAGVGCEACHGPARDHVENVGDASLRPTVDIGAEVCGVCHTGEHHPTFDDWSESGHATVTEHVAEGLVEGSRVNSCGICHSGDAFYAISVQGETLEEDAFEGMAIEELNGVTCAVCHDPHQRTGNAPEAEDGRDYQLRYGEIAAPTPTNTVDAATNPLRFNVCGQCHHSRGGLWTATSRGPHHSVQSNVYVGEMPSLEADGAGEGEPLVLSRASVHLRATEQCATCHLYRQDFQDEFAPAISGHTFMVNYLGCASTGCHSSSTEAQTRGMTFQAVVQARLDDIETRLDAWAAANPVDADADTVDWEYSAEGGPAVQSAIPDVVKQVRFLLRYVENDGSLGIHNPGYVEAILDKAEELLDGLGV